MEQQLKRRGGSPRFNTKRAGEAWSSTSQTSFSGTHEDARSPARRKMRSLSKESTSNLETDNGFLGRAYENASHVDIEDDLIVVQA